MMLMTEKSNDTDDPSSPPGVASPVAPPHHLHIVAGDAAHSHHEAEKKKPREGSIFGFLKTLVKGKSENDLHSALKEYVADLENNESEIAADERALIENILSLRGLRAVDVMIPRADIVAIDSTISAQDLLSLLSEKQYSRLPVYRDSLDDVIGSIHIKDILAVLARNEKIEIENLIRDVPIVSPAMHVLDLLLEMKQTRRHMALVVDEFGGIDGLVTVGDIIGAIVGEIEDEHEVDDQPQMTIAPDGTVIADGRVDIEELEEKFGAFLSDAERQDIDTLGGLVFAIAGRVPTRGEVLSHDSGLVFEVLDADPRRVSRLRIKNIPQDISSE
jgi:CBS domain containing-hemolysin-like protein